MGVFQRALGKSAMWAMGVSNILMKIVRLVRGSSCELVLLLSGELDRQTSRYAIIWSGELSLTDTFMIACISVILRLQHHAL
jgi:hypothetical protein